MNPADGLGKVVKVHEVVFLPSAEKHPRLSVAE